MSEKNLAADRLAMEAYQAIQRPAQDVRTAQLVAMYQQLDERGKRSVFASAVEQFQIVKGA
jgi:hypothetical protein